MAVLHEDVMPAAAVLQPVGLNRVVPVFAAVMLGWLHGAGERALLTTNLGCGLWGCLCPVLFWAMTILLRLTLPRCRLLRHRHS